MRLRCLPPVLFTIAALAFSGCESGISARIQEKSTAYATFSDDLKARINQGSVDLGDSADAAYIALGKPSVTGTRSTENGEVQVWTYKRFVIGQELASKVIFHQPAQRFVGTPAAGPAGRIGGGGSGTSTSPTRGNPQVMVDAGEVETVTLLVDIQNDKVVALRVEQ